ncbi:hypothetical protein DPMN_120428 [Dreissena polymorpha]|uniref:PHD-type domain-containing protein n=1 Tax=Dreissena polymorpha TaxID=45954 RepID=A0A9D4JNJ1_DREPO|nr:hypothetical protein DPMN_120428 [Dreissena polymorpha]
MPAPPCLFCLRRIHSTSRAVTCDKCQRWHHIRCENTGITEDEYDEAVRNQHELRFVCMRCRHYDTTDDDEDMDVDAEEVSHLQQRVPNGPMVTEETQAHLLLNEEADTCDVTDAAATDHATSMFDVCRPERVVELEEQET